MLVPPLKTALKTAKEQKASLVQKLKSAAFPLTLIELSILNGFAGNPILVIVGVVSGILALAQPYLDDKRTFLLMLGLLVFSFVNLLAEPAHAQFFNNAQTFFTNTFTASGTAIPLVFNTLRALYIIYLAIAFIGVFNSVRQDEDWVTAARTPILVVICVTLAYILTSLITG